MDLLEYLRNGFLAVQARSLVLLADDAVEEVATQARRLGNATLVRAMELIGQALIDMRDSVDPRITLEVALVRLTAPEADDSPAALLQRVERLERLLGERGEPGDLSVPALQATQVLPRPEPRPPAGPQPPVIAEMTEPPAPPPPRLPRPQSALGAHRKPREPTSGDSEGAPDAVMPDLPAASLPRGMEEPAPGPTFGQRRHAPAAETATAAPATAATAASGASPAATPLGPLPTRQQLTLAWGDHIFPMLRPGVKIYLSAGRFVEVDKSTAVYAVPDKGLLDRAEPNRGEVEAALAAHFGRPVPLRLVLDAAADPGAAPPRPATQRPEEQRPEDPDDYDLDDLQNAPIAVASPEQRLLEAFPGAEEVSS
jgi:DNA polymerase III subunit gamma/tau